MNKVLEKVGVGVATGALFALLATSAFASTSVTIKGNGAKSHNTSTVTHTTTSILSQSNSTGVSTWVGQSANTGYNSANGNTGKGDVSITTGNAKNTVHVDVTGGSNTAVSPTCCCGTSGDTTVTIQGNGKSSTSSSTVTSSCTQTVSQASVTEVETGIEQSSNTGNNSANSNTGSGGTTITSGNSVNTTTISVTGGDNTVGPSI